MYGIFQRYNTKVKDVKLTKMTKNLSYEFWLLWFNKLERRNKEYSYIKRKNYLYILYSFYFLLQ